MKKELPNTFEVIGMIDMAIRIFEVNSGMGVKTELEKNAIEILKEAVSLLSCETMSALSKKHLNKN